MGKYFEYDRQIGEDELCGLYKTKDTILEYVNAGSSVKIFGRRNFGKTSLVKNVVAKAWKGQDDNRMIIYTDFYGVLDHIDIARELSLGLENGILSLRSRGDRVLNVLKSLKNIRPIYQVTDQGIELSIKSMSSDAPAELEDIIKNIAEFKNTKNIDVLLIIDEFQEIFQVKGAEARLRREIESLPKGISVILMGSKYHLLQKIFSVPTAPFYNWGFSVEFTEIPYDTYCEYINSRVKEAKFQFPHEICQYIQDKLLREPEAINRFCDYFAIKYVKNKKIDIENINNTMQFFLDDSRSKFSETYSRLSLNERKVLKAFAKFEQVKNYTGKQFIQIIQGISKEGIRKIVERLLDSAVVIRLENEKNDSYYTIADPYLSMYIKKYK